MLSAFFYIRINDKWNFYPFQHISAQQSNSANVNNISNPVDFLVYENSTFGIKINYPKNWVLETVSEEPPTTNIITFYSPEIEDFVLVSLDTLIILIQKLIL